MQCGFPYSYPEYLSPVLRILGDGEDHSKEEIREHILSAFPLTLDQLAMKRPGYRITVFVNKVAFAFNRLVFHRAITEERSGTYRITDHGRDILSGHPNDARERDL